MLQLSNANHHQTFRIKDDGTVLGCIARDAQEAPKGSKNRQLQPLSTGRAEPKASPADANAQRDQTADSSTSSEHLTRAQSRRRLRSTLKALARRQQAKCLEDVVKLPRRNHREAALDTARRQLLAMTLAENVPPVNEEPAA